MLSGPLPLAGLLHQRPGCAQISPNPRPVLGLRHVVRVVTMWPPIPAENEESFAFLGWLRFQGKVSRTQEPCGADQPRGCRYGVQCVASWQRCRSSPKLCISRFCLRLMEADACAPQARWPAVFGYLQLCSSHGPTMSHGQAGADCIVSEILGRQ